MKNNVMLKNLTIRVFSFLALSYLALTQSIYAQYRCPQGIGASQGDNPFYVYTSKQGRQLAFCGWSEVKPDGKLEASEYEVVNTSNGNVLLRFGALERTFVTTKEILEIIQVVYLPSGNEWNYSPIERYIYRPRETNKGIEFQKEYVFAPPKLDNQQIAAVLKLFQTLKKKRYGNEQISGMLMLAALSGSQDAKEIFENLKGYLILDGAVAEAYTQVRDVYKEYTKSKEHNKPLKGDAAKSRPP